MEIQCSGNDSKWDFKFEDDEDFGAIIYLLCVEFLISDSIWARLSECDGSRGCDGWVSIR